MRSIIGTSIVITGLAAGLAACSADSTGVNGTAQPVSVSFSTLSSTATAYAASASLSPDAAPSRNITVTSGTDVLVITKAQLVLSRIELQVAGAACADTAAVGDDTADEHSCAELSLSPSVIDLPVDASVLGKLGVTVPAGSYSALEVKVRAIRAGDHGTGSAAFLTAHPDLAGVSVLVQGTFNGKAFTYTGSPKAELEASFNPPLTVTTTGVNLTVNVDLATWFRASGGALVDPSTANPGGVNANAVADNIKRSFKAFRDDNHDGHDDGPNHG